jgi:hypothetical protein
VLSFMSQNIHSVVLKTDYLFAFKCGTNNLSNLSPWTSDITIVALVVCSSPTRLAFLCVVNWRAANVVSLQVLSRH